MQASDLTIFIVRYIVRPRSMRHPVTNNLPGCEYVAQSISPATVTSRNTFGREQPSQVIKRCFGSVHFVDISYRPFATDNTPSVGSYFADALWRLTIELKSVVAPQLRSHVRAINSPSGDTALDFTLLSQLLQPVRHRNPTVARNSRLPALVLTSFLIPTTSDELRFFIPSSRTLEIFFVTPCPTSN